MKYLVLIHLDEYVTEAPPEALLDAMVAHVADETQGGRRRLHHDRRADA